MHETNSYRELKRGFEAGVEWALKKSPLEKIKRDLESEISIMAFDLIRAGSDPKEDPEVHRRLLIMAHLDEVQKYTEE
tara:strand:+ start:3010 stop:3243 length:234 start_codon:yes stop_codon:yes gene_type:complete